MAGLSIFCHRTMKRKSANPLRGKQGNEPAGKCGNLPRNLQKGVCRFLEVLGGNLGELAGLGEVSEQTLLPSEITPTLARRAHVTWRVITISPRELKRSRADELRSIL
jgi:hypothetical protein